MAKQIYGSDYQTKLVNGIPEADFPVQSLGDRIDYHPNNTVEIETAPPNITIISAHAGFNPVV